MCAKALGMNKFRWKFLTAISFLVVASEYAQERVKPSVLGEPDDSVLRSLPHWTFTTEAYQREALRLLIEEANRVARELKLSEHLPITQSNLVEVFIQPPALGMFGTISTSNYVYYASVGKKLSGVSQRKLNEVWVKEQKEYVWPVSRLDTNAAFHAATQIMTAARMDVRALNRDFTIDVHATMSEGPYGARFVPDYWVAWLKEGKSVALIEFFEPTRSIRQLVVFDPKYILREPIRVPNLAKLLSQTNVLTKPLESLK